MKTSNLILTTFGLVFVVVLIAKDLSSEKRENFDSNKTNYKSLQINQNKLVNHLVIDGYNNFVKYQINQGGQLKIEVINSENSKDSCSFSFKNDTLLVNINNKSNYSNTYDVPNVKITTPKILSIKINNVSCSLVGINSDSLSVIANTEYGNTNLEKCKIKYLNFNGINSIFSINATNNISHLNFKSIGIGGDLHLDGVLINKIDFKSDSAVVKLSGKSVEKYLN